jgi:hypothetical protein
VLKSKGIILLALFSPISLITTKFMGAKAGGGEKEERRQQEGHKNSCVCFRTVGRSKNI